VQNYVKIQCTTNDKGKLIPLEDFKDVNKLNTYLKQVPGSDWYSTLFYFPEDIVPYFERDLSIRGWNGAAHSQALVWDFDCGLDPSKAQKDAIILLQRLQNEGVAVNSSVSVWFSGGKGFHVSCCINREITPETMKNVCENLAKDLETFDSVIYNSVRIFRISNTKHPKSGLYKIELTPDELLELNLKQIQDLAKFPRPVGFIPTPTNVDLVSKYNIQVKPKFSIVKPTLEVVKTIPTNGIRGLDKIDFRKCPKNVPRCIYALINGIMRPGERQVILFRLATYFRNQGMPKEVTGRMLKGICELNSRLYPEIPVISKEEVWQQAIASAYKEGGQFKQVVGATGVSQDNDIIREYCDAVPIKSECILHHRDKHNTTVKIDEVAEWFSEFAKNYDRNIVKTGINFLDDNLRMQIGTTYHLVGCNGSGKTTTMLNAFENSGKLGQHSVFFSLDMDKRMVYLKLATRLTNYSQTQIIQFYKDNNLQKKSEIKKAIAEKYGNTFFDFSSTLSLEQMRDKVFAIEETTKNKMNLIVVDFAGRISGPYSDKYANACYNALKASEMAKLTDSTWLFVHQISRSNGDVFTPLRSRRVIKESGDWEDNAAGIVNIWRPYVGIPSRDHVMRVFICKNKMGNELESLLYWNGEQSLVRDMTEQELLEYDHPEDELKLLKERILR
jgi:KaiC/GvpD/RAD55 family RecA-like ATPase